MCSRSWKLHTLLHLINKLWTHEMRCSFSPKAVEAKMVIHTYMYIVWWLQLSPTILDVQHSQQRDTIIANFNHPIIVSDNCWTWKFRTSRNTIACAIYTHTQRFSGTHGIAVLWITVWKQCCVLPVVLCLSQLVDTRWLPSDVMFVSEIYLKYNR